jgi:hypothetical protein
MSILSFEHRAGRSDMQFSVCIIPENGNDSEFGAWRLEDQFLRRKQGVEVIV